MRTSLTACLLACLALVPSSPARAEAESPNYPHPLQKLSLRAHGKDLQMAYMDVAPRGNPGGVEPKPAEPYGTVLLFHGKNFNGAYWQQTITALSDAGFRVIVPDQVGFGASSRPAMPYSFHELATFTRILIEELKVPKAAVVGHSMGGMLATRFALMFPATTSSLILENPIGLEDYRDRVPYVPTDELTEQTSGQSEAAVRKYHESYYGKWQPAFEKWVKLQFSSQQGEGAYISAITSQMIYEQPVCHEFSQLRVPTLLIIGQKDRTAIGKDRVTREVAAELGNFPQLGKVAADAIPQASLVALPELGHVPHLEDPATFNRHLVEFLRSPRPTAASGAGDEDQNKTANRAE